MKHCPACAKEVPQEFDFCWNCQYDFILEKTYEPKEVAEIKSRELICSRCDIEMKFHRKNAMHVGLFVGVLTRKLVLTSYKCDKCKKVEFFDFDEE